MCSFISNEADYLSMLVSAAAELVGSIVDAQRIMANVDETQAPASARDMMGRAPGTEFLYRQQPRGVGLVGRAF
jgi:hypothetical protein